MIELNILRALIIELHDNGIPVCEDLLNQISNFYKSIDKSIGDDTLMSGATTWPLEITLNDRCIINLHNNILQIYIQHALIRGDYVRREQFDIGHPDSIDNILVFMIREFNK